MRGRSFGRGPANILYNSQWLASGGEERRREAIRVGVANRKTFGKAVGGRPSLLHNRDGSPGKLCQSVRDARDFGLTYRRIAKRFGIGRTTAWWHDKNCRDKNLRDKSGIRGRSKTEKRDATDSAEEEGSIGIMSFQRIKSDGKGPPVSAYKQTVNFCKREPYKELRGHGTQRDGFRDCPYGVELPQELSKDKSAPRDAAEDCAELPAEPMEGFGGTSADPRSENKAVNGGGE